MRAARSDLLLVATVVVVSGAGCGGSVVAEPDDGAGAAGGAATTASTTTATCGLSGPCDLECCDGYECAAGACAPHLADGRCWSSSFPATCDPRSPDACGTNASCRLDLDGTIEVACDGPAPVGELGAACDAGSGCKPTLMCRAGHCGKACCSEEECASGQHCNVFAGQLGSLGTCGP